MWQILEELVARPDFWSENLYYSDTCKSESTPKNVQYALNYYYRNNYLYEKDIEGLFFNFAFIIYDILGDFKQFSEILGD